MFRTLGLLLGTGLAAGGPLMADQERRGPLICLWVALASVVLAIALWWWFNRRRKGRRVPGGEKGIEAAPQVKALVPKAGAEATQPKPVLETRTPQVAVAAPEVEAPAPEAGEEAAQPEPEVETEAPQAQIAVPRAEMPAPDVEATPTTVEAPSPEATPPQPDDLKVIEGIGPKISGILQAAGVATFTQLAALDPQHVREMLAEGGLLAPANPDTWPKQAALPAEGKWEDLRALQSTLRGGRRV